MNVVTEIVSATSEIAVAYQNSSAVLFVEQNPGEVCQGCPLSMVPGMLGICSRFSRDGVGEGWTAIVMNQSGEAVVGKGNCGLDASALVA